MPKDIGMGKRKKGEISVRSSNENIMALVWKDKKDVKMLSTMHTSVVVNTGKKDRKDNTICKPQCVLDYSKGMGGIDQVSANVDQQGSM